MNFEIRISAPLDRLAMRLRTALRAGRRGASDGAMVVGLPSTSSLRDLPEMAALSRFEEPSAESA